MNTPTRPATAADNTPLDRAYLRAPAVPLIPGYFSDCRCVRCGRDDTSGEFCACCELDIHAALAACSSVEFTEDATALIVSRARREWLACPERDVADVVEECAAAYLDGEERWTR